jgi:hypothetical protein
MTVLKDIFVIEKHFTNKKTPCDIVEMLEDKTYSKSKNQFIKHGDMHLSHYIRSTQKAERDNHETIKKLNQKIRRLRELILDQ